MLYLNPFLAAFLTSVILLFLIVNFFGKNSDTRKNKRHIHAKNISRWGGAAIFVAFFVAIFLDKNLIVTRDIWGILIGAIFIFSIGLWDDFKELNWKTQLFFQIAAVAVIFIFGIKIETLSNPFGEIIFLDGTVGWVLGFLIASGWILILTNAMNWLDGIDGLSGGIFLISFLAMFFLALKPEVNQPPVGILAIILLGVSLGFLIFNFPPGKIMLGSSGVFFLGFLLAGLSIFAGTKIATTLLVLFVPMIDFFWVIVQRLKTGKKITDPDKEHLHHKLLAIGWTQKRIDLFFYFVTLLVLLIALNAKGLEKILVIFILFLAMMVFYWSIEKKSKQFKNE